MQDPAFILSNLFPIGGAEDFTLDDSDAMRSAQGYTFAHADLVWEPSSPNNEDGPPLVWGRDGRFQVLMYAFRVTDSLSAAQATSQQSGLNDVRLQTSHEVFVWTPDGQGGASRRRVLNTGDLAAGVLTPRVQRALSLNPQTQQTVGAVAITAILPVRTGVAGACARRRRAPTARAARARRPRTRRRPRPRRRGSC